MVRYIIGLATQKISTRSWEWCHRIGEIFWEFLWGLTMINHNGDDMGSIWINTLRWYGLSIDSWFISYECSIIRWFFHIWCAIVKHSGEFYWGMVMNPKLMGWMTIPHHLLTMAHEPYLYVYIYIFWSCQVINMYFLTILNHTVYELLKYLWKSWPLPCLFRP